MGITKQNPVETAAATAKQCGRCPKLLTCVSYSKKVYEARISNNSIDISNKANGHQRGQLRETIEKSRAHSNTQMFESVRACTHPTNISCVTNCASSAFQTDHATHSCAQRFRLTLHANRARQNSAISQLHLEFTAIR